MYITLYAYIIRVGFQTAAWESQLCIRPGYFLTHIFESIFPTELFPGKIDIYVT